MVNISYQGEEFQETVPGVWTELVTAKLGLLGYLSIRTSLVLFLLEMKGEDPQVAMHSPVDSCSTAPGPRLEKDS